MSQTVLLQTKFLVPRMGETHLARPALVEQICDSRRVPCTLLIAPAGYGKTSLLTELADVYSGSLAWLHLDDGDNDPATFMAYLVESVRRQNEKLLPPGIFQTEDNIAPDRMLIVLINQLLANGDQDWLLVLDDYNVIHNPAVHQLMTLLLDNLPPSMRIVIASRITPALPLARWRTQNRLLELRTEHLRFSRDETRIWLEQQAYQLPAPLIDQLVTRTEGWGAGLQLATNLIDPGAKSADVIEHLTGTQPHIFDYLMEEVFTRQPAEIQSFLLRSAVFDGLTPDTAQVVLDIKNADEILDRLERDGLFVSRLHNQNRWYRYHELFRDFLLNRLQARYPDHYARIRTSAGDYFARQGQSEVAVHHFLGAGKLIRAEDMLAQFADDYLRQGRFDEVQQHLNAFPVTFRAESAKLSLIQARLSRQRGQFGMATAQLNQIVERDEITSISCRAYVELSTIRQSQGKYGEAVDMATKAVELGGHMAVCDHVPALMQLANCAGFVNGMDHGYKIAQQAYDLMMAHTDAFSAYDRARLLHMLGQICWWRGDVQQAVAYCRRAITLLDDTQTQLKARLLVMLSIPTLYQKDHATALDLAEQAIAICQELQLKEVLPAAYAALGNTLTRLGELEQAESYLRRSMEQALSMGGARHAEVMAAGYLAQNLTLQGRVNEAQTVAKHALDYYGDRITGYDVYVCKSVLADLLLDTDQLQEAKAIFSTLIDIGETTQYRIPLAMAYFGMAYVLLREHQADEAVEFAQKSLALVEPAMMHQLYLDQRERALVVCEHLAQHLPDNRFVQQVYDALGGKRQVISVQPAAVESTAPVTVHTFGGLRVYRGGVEIESRAFASAKARDLLAYFITMRTRSTRIDRAVFDLWPDDSGSISAFHTALYRVRVALRVDDEKDKFILSELGEYRLDSTKFDLDVVRFDALLHDVQIAANAQAISLYERALALYQGDYLDNGDYAWMIAERERLQQTYLRAIDGYCTLLAGDDRLNTVADWQARALDIDPYNEALHVRYMRTLHRLGNPQKVIEHYRQLESLLHDAFNAPPMKETQDAFHALVS